jgi:tetratricopeptide (TPR) repeat protein
MEPDPPRPKGKDKKVSDHKIQVEKQAQAHNQHLEGKKYLDKFNKDKRKEDAEMAIQKFSEAITSLQSCPSSEKGDINAEYHADRGNAFMAIGHYQKAMYDFGTAIRFQKEKAQYYANRGNCMMMLNQINDALSEF